MHHGQVHTVTSLKIAIHNQWLGMPGRLVILACYHHEISEYNAPVFLDRTVHVVDDIVLTSIAHLVNALLHPFKNTLGVLIEGIVFPRGAEAIKQILSHLLDGIKVALGTV